MDWRSQFHCRWFTALERFPDDLLPFGHFPGGPWLAGTRMSPFWILLELRVMKLVHCTVTTAAIRCAKLQSNRHYPTNQHPLGEFKRLLKTHLGLLKWRPISYWVWQWCKQDQILKTKNKTDFLVSDRSCPKIDDLRPHHWFIVRRV